MIDRQTLAESICEKIHLDSTHTNSSWSQRIADYEWKKLGPVQTFNRLSALERPMRPLLKKIEAEKKLTLKELNQLTSFAHAVFDWGNVTRSNNEKAEDGNIVRKVILAGLNWEIPPTDVPMNSGWTKVTAISSEFLEGTERKPQVIFDSRVAASLITRIEQTFLELGLDTKLNPTSYLPRGIQAFGYIPGRGGTRTINGHRQNEYSWRTKYQRWDAQFAASLLTSDLKDILNSNSRRYGEMPFSQLDGGGWTTRGVEMVLFMDGY